MLFLLGTMAMAASLRFADESALQGCRVVTGVSTADGVQQCCNSCSDGFLLRTEWLLDETRTHNQDDDNTILQNEIEEKNGSGDLKSQDVSMVWKIHSTDAITTSLTPCGMCIRPQQCIVQGWVVNTWHRLCQVPKNA